MYYINNFVILHKQDIKKNKEREKIFMKEMERSMKIKNKIKTALKNKFAICYDKLKLP